MVIQLFCVNLFISHFFEEWSRQGGITHFSYKGQMRGVSFFPLFSFAIYLSPESARLSRVIVTPANSMTRFGTYSDRAFCFLSIALCGISKHSRWASQNESHRSSVYFILHTVCRRIGHMDYIAMILQAVYQPVPVVVDSTTMP